MAWAPRLTVIGTIVSLIVGTITVLTAAVGAYRYWMTPENSALVFAAQGGTAATLSVLVSNKGSKAGSVRAGSLVLDNGALLTLHISGLDKNEPKVIEPGKAELIKFYSEGRMEEIYVPKNCTLHLVGADLQGKRPDEHVKLDCADVQSFLSAHGPNVR